MNNEKCNNKYPIPITSDIPSEIKITWNWIKTSERFPTREEQDQGVLVYFNDESKLMGIQPKGTYIGPCDPYPYLGPSHWMKAPEPPKDE